MPDIELPTGLSPSITSGNYYTAALVNAAKKTL